MNYKLLYNPFERYQERTLILVGSLALVAGAVLAFFFKARFDGVLDLHFASQIELWQAFADQGVNVACLLISLGAVAFYMNKRTRIIDMLAVCLFARLPYYLLSVFNVNGLMVRISEEILKDPMALAKGDIAIANLFLLLVFSGFSLLAIVWQLALLYNGTKVASNAKGTTYTILFVIAIIVAEILSKLLINY
ncbi:hypothetical protein ACFQ3R_08300 [Mesonia ostreae]|uniref:Yip1 domain-containing protein n=1 Tax=Mesonia ostreae TaxID=861110 RepID=A0ABU2KF51_9FLAO|nr:hypothetical protein [Mesonia ostreae]MDT0293328.1 hypothetical protein [Mesonia ostreae]